jgi:uncharacterized membrane protein YkgB
VNLQPAFDTCPRGLIETVLTPRRLHALRSVGLGVLRYGLVFVLVLLGGFKFFAFEAEAIKPFIEHSPFMSWLYALFSPRMASALLGVFEITTGLLIATRHWSPRTSGAASLVASGMFLATVSFLFTTPGVLKPSSYVGGFLMKDLFLLGAAIYTGAEALLASHSNPGTLAVAAET